MTDYAKLVGGVIYSANSDYSDPRVDSKLLKVAITPDEYLHRHIQMKDLGRYTLDLGAFNSVTTLFIYNRDSSAPIWAEFYSQDGSAAAGDLDFGDDDPDTILDNAGGDFTTTPEYAHVGGYVRVASAEDSGNDGLHLIQAIGDSGATNDLITLAASSSLTDNVNDTAATLSFETKNRIKLAAAGMLCYYGNIVVASDIILQAYSGTPELDIYIFGT